MADEQWIVGIDEAGYGPNLGPLCVAASVWRVDDRLRPEQLYPALADLVGTTPRDGRLTVADSKRLYQGSGSLARLELGVLGALRHLGRLSEVWRDLWPAIDAEASAQIDELPWHAGYDERLPCAAAQTEVEQAAGQWQAARQRGVQLADLAGCVLFPARFNHALADHGNKAEVLLKTTTALLQRVLARCPDLPVQVLCDRQGGRKYYWPQVQDLFPERLVRVQREDAQASHYVAWQGGRPVTLHFEVAGERLLPVALASMTAKYLRELAMRPFNSFWQRQVPGLKPTAGYPADAGRFLKQIQPVMARLRIAPDLIWRRR